MKSFQYEFIPKATSVIGIGHGPLYYQKAVKPHLHSFMGSVFEDMCRYYTLQHGILEEFDCFIRNRKKAVIGECKFKNKKIDKGIYETLIRRFHLITAKYRIVKYILFSLSGYTDWFDTLSDDNVVLLSLDDLYV